MDSLTATAMQDPEGFLGHPVNAFKLMKRLNTEWSSLESLVLSDTTDGTDKDNLLQIIILCADTVSYSGVLPDATLSAKIKGMFCEWR